MIPSMLNYVSPLELLGPTIPPIFKPDWRFCFDISAFWWSNKQFRWNQRNQSDSTQEPEINDLKIILFNLRFLLFIWSKFSAESIQNPLYKFWIAIAMWNTLPIASSPTLPSWIHVCLVFCFALGLPHLTIYERHSSTKVAGAIMSFQVLLCSRWLVSEDNNAALLIIITTIYMAQ